MLSKIVIFVFLCTFVTAHQEYESEEDIYSVKGLDRNNYAKFLKENSIVFVKFYVPWCKFW